MNHMFMARHLSEITKLGSMMKCLPQAVTASFCKWGRKQFERISKVFDGSRHVIKGQRGGSILGVFLRLSNG
jgi:hypothetical protein